MSSEQFTGILKGDRFNYLKPDGSYLSKDWYISIGPFREGFALVQREDEMYNYLKPDGSYLSKEWYPYATPFDGGYAKVKLFEFGFVYKIDKYGKITD